MQPNLKVVDVNGCVLDMQTLHLSPTPGIRLVQDTWM
jgi:hypothetical protein